MLKYLESHGYLANSRFQTVVQKEGGLAYPRSFACSEMCYLSRMMLISVYFTQYKLQKTVDRLRWNSKVTPS